MSVRVKQVDDKVEEVVAQDQHARHLVTLLDKVSCGVILHFDQPADPILVPFPSDWLLHLLPILVRLSHDLYSDFRHCLLRAPSRYKTGNKPETSKVFAAAGGA